MFGRSGRSRAFSRRLTVALALFGVVVLLDFVLFGWLIFRSLSEQEIERALFETRLDAEDIAERLANQAERRGGDLYTVIATERDTRTSIEGVLRQRGFISSVEVRDREGRLVYETTSEERVAVDGESLEPRGGPGGIGQGDEGMGDGLAGGLDLEVPPVVPPDGSLGEGPEVVSERRFEFQVEEPIGELGTIRIAIDRAMLESRAALLRRDLLGQAVTIGLVTTALLLGGGLLMWLLVRRGQVLEDQAAEAEKMAYVGTLASGLAHEIRNPLNSLNLNMQMLEEELEEVGEVPTGKRLLSITRGEIGRLERLVTDFLSYARPRPLELEEVPAVELLEAAGELLVFEARQRGVSLVVEDRTGGARVRVDRGQLRQLLLNLAQNALAATEGAGRPGTVELVVEPGGSRAGGRAEARVELSVRDNGAGMDAEERERIFEIFYSTRRGGTGLGLAIVQRIAQAHDGVVTVDSEPGEGTTVTVSLPLAGGGEG